MEKNGFTLVELLVVIVIIGIMSILIVPSAININKRINERFLSQKIEHIESAAKLYANNNEEIFNGTDEALIYVHELIDANYMTVDVGVGDKCNQETNISSKGCILNPVNSESLNNSYVIVKKEGVGVSVSFYNPDDPSNMQEGYSAPLVLAVCKGFENGDFEGHAMNSAGEIVNCKCKITTTSTSEKIVGFLDDLGNDLDVSACLIAGENVNNFLKYGDTKANWRVLGVYKDVVDRVSGFYAKIITNEPV